MTWRALGEAEVVVKVVVRPMRPLALSVGMNMGVCVLVLGMPWLTVRNVVGAVCLFAF